MDFNRMYSQGQYVMRRYVTYDSFRDAFSSYQAGHVPAYIKVQILFVEDL